MSLDLRPYQELAIAASLASPWQRQLIVLSTGMGKTITGLALAKRKACKTLWLAHREELITQPAKALQLVWPEARSGIVKAELNQYMRDVVFASVQSAMQERRRDQLASQGFGLVVVDEAHHALSPSYVSLLQALGCMKPGGPTLLGLTATPERSDNGALSEVFEGIVFQVGITTAIAGGYLVPPRIIERPINVDLDSITVSRGDYGAKQLDLALMQAGIVNEITAAYEEHCTSLKTLIFVVSVAQAEAVAAALRARGHRVAALSGETPPEQRASILRRLKTGEITCVVNCMVLTEGFDEPSVNCVMLARPTQSKPLMIQKVGRGLRLFPGKSDCLVIDMVGASKRNTLVQAAVLFGLRPEPEERPKRTGELSPLTDPEEYWRQRLLSQIEGVGGAPRSKLRWVPGEAGAWLLDAGLYGTLRMLPAEGDTWTVDAVGVRTGNHKRLTLSDAPVPMDIAQAIAEDYVRRYNAVNKSIADAPWRSDAATEKQVAFLRRSGVKVKAGITKGTAEDLALQVKAKHATEPATPEQIKYVRAMYGASKTPANLTKKEAQAMIVKARFRKGGAR